MNLYGSQMAARAAGVTYRQLDYWCRQGYLPASTVEASGSGTRRRFTRQQVWQIATCGALMASTPALGQPAEAMRMAAIAAIDLAADPDAGSVEVETCYAVRVHIDLDMIRARVDRHLMANVA